MRVCPDCPEIDDDGNSVEPNLSRDQRAWVQDGRCVDCHDRARRSALMLRLARRPEREPYREPNWCLV